MGHRVMSNHVVNIEAMIDVAREHTAHSGIPKRIFSWFAGQYQGTPMITSRP
jgi:hypothetical protein